MKLLERVQTAWNTLRDKEQAELLLQGPLPLWMQERFEREAERRGMAVGDLIFEVLQRAARRLPRR